MTPRIRTLIVSPEGPAAEMARREGAKLLGLAADALIQAPLSPTGRPPTTHWLCENYFSAEIFEKMKGWPRPLGTEVIDGRVGTTAQLLGDRGLKRIPEEDR